MIDPTSAILCLALNVHFEARGEPIKGQLADAHVTLNRARKQKRSICDVVFSPNQFSWTIKDPKVRDEKAWKQSLKVAKKAFYTGKAGDPTKGANHYHADYVRPRWASSMTHTVTIGRHIFYID